MAKKVVYVAHPLGNGEDRARNIQNAAHWCTFLAEFYNVIPVCHWVALALVWDESHRDLAMEIDKAVVGVCDETYLVGGTISPGMQEESDHARSLGKKVRDFTYLGYLPPNRIDPLSIPLLNLSRPSCSYGCCPGQDSTDGHADCSGATGTSFLDSSVAQQIETHMDSTPGKGGPG